MVFVMQHVQFMCTLWIQIFPEKEQKNTPVIIPQSYFRTEGTGGYIDVPNHGLDFRSFEKNSHCRYITGITMIYQPNL